MRNSARLTPEQARQIWDYNPDTGVFIWKIATRDRAGRLQQTKRVGSVAGYELDSGHIALKYRNYEYRAHRVAWLLMTGVWPDRRRIYHVNKDYSDNSWSNLRQVDKNKTLYIFGDSTIETEGDAFKRPHINVSTRED